LNQSGKKLTVGIPRAGLYYKYFPFWKTFLENLDVAVLLSPVTEARLLAAGLKIANSEMCLPLKIMYGHVKFLLDKADYILLPQMDEVKTGAARYGLGSYFCPYFVGLADVFRAEFPSGKFLDPLMSFQDGVIEKDSWLQLGRQLGKSSEVSARAWSQAVAVQKEFEEQQISSGKTTVEILENINFVQPDSGRTIGLVGRPYLIHDQAANLYLLKKIFSRGCRVRTLEMIPTIEKEHALKAVPVNQRSHWALTNEEYGALHVLGKSPDIAGIIYVIPFNCGPDFVVDEFVIKEIRRRKPVTVISIDESTGEAGLTTRLDAFLDMIPNK
jgi:predicted nucleotide-binding protein (sugar kinase/HSP70/actin superfamily)